MHALSRFWAAASVPIVRGAAFVGLNALFWSAVAVALLRVIEAFRPAIAGPRSFVLLHVGSCFAATVVLRWLARRDGLLARAGVSRAGAIVGGLLVATVVTTLWTAAIDARAGLPPHVSPRRYLVALSMVHLGLLATWSLFAFGWMLVREAGVAVRLRREAEARALAHLQGRLDPRFLLEAIDTVAACRADPRAVDTVTRALSGYLRFLVEPTAPLEPLGRELDAVGEYLTVQRVRWGDRFEAAVDCAAELRDIPVLPMMIQPLVENACNHGGEPGAARRIAVRVTRDGDELVIEVGNSGRWVQPDAAARHGGIQALRRRLEFWSGPAATLTASEEVGWVWMTLRARLERRYAAPAVRLPAVAAATRA